MRAREPDDSGFAVVEDRRTYYEVFGDGPTTVVLMATNPVVDGRQWKAQVHYLARHFRVVVWDARGNGRSDRPSDPDAYAEELYVEDALAVLDASSTDTAFLVALCAGVRWSLALAAAHPERVRGLVAIAPAVPLDEPSSHPLEAVDEAQWHDDFDGWARYHSDALLAEPHSSKIYDDLVGWTIEAGAEALTARTQALRSSAAVAASPMVAQQVSCPVLVIHGSADACQSVDEGRYLAELTGGRLVVLDGAGHLPHARHPVLVNTLVRDFVSEHSSMPRPPEIGFCAQRHKRRALWVSSPIGLGHVLRDVAIARALRDEVPDLEIEWLAQSPVTEVLREHGEIIHPASDDLASESAHWESEAADHELHAFLAFRRMDEIFCANYMLFDDVVRETSYDLWVGDESWEVDHFLHENPERKIAPFAFLTDVTGFLPVDPDGDPREAELCADYNAEIIEHLERFPSVRDRSLFIGDFAELPDASLGAGLPGVREWSAKAYSSVPYVVPFEPSAYRDPTALRRRLGYGTGFPLYIAAVGGTAVGRDLLELTTEAFALVRKDEPDARMVMVTGPRMSPDDLPDVEGMDKVGYVHDLFAHLACADAAIVQGGLSTTMELVAARRPFVYFPIADHWEQQHFVAHRLDHYRAGTRMQYRTTRPADLAAAMTAARATVPRYRAVRRDGAARAARQLAPLLRR